MKALYRLLLSYSEWLQEAFLNHCFGRLPTVLYSRVDRILFEGLLRAKGTCIEFELGCCQESFEKKQLVAASCLIHLILFCQSVGSVPLHTLCSFDLSTCTCKLRSKGRKGLMRLPYHDFRNKSGLSGLDLNINQTSSPRYPAHTSWLPVCIRLKAGKSLQAVYPRSHYEMQQSHLQGLCDV